MNWIKIKVEYYSLNMKIAKEKIINIFSEIGISQLEMEDYFSENSLDYLENFDNKNDVWSITGFVINNKFSKTKLNIILEQLEKLNTEIKDLIYEVYTSEFSENSYKDEWKKYFHTTKITDRITVKPSWEEYEKKDSEIVIEIDPGMAFGTGIHETTSLCIESLEKHIKESDKSLLDIGCGSGILMLVSKKMGVSNVVGIDIDKNCEEVVINNFEKNNISEGYEVIIGDLVKKIDEKYDIIVSNVLADVLTILLKDIEKVLKPNSLVIFSGIVNEKANDFFNETQKYSLKLIEKNQKKNWVSFVMRYEK